VKKRIFGLIFIVLVLVFIYAPILILAFYSFTNASQIGAFQAFSLKNYATLFNTEELRQMIIGTVLLAFGCSFIATLIGSLGAIGSFYSSRRANTFFNTLNEIPVINADVVSGFSACILLVVVLGIGKETFIPLVIGETILCAPFVYLSVMPKLKQMDPSLYEAALDLGATPAAALWKIIVPQVASGIISGFMMAITLCLDDYFIATYTKPATFDTISTYVVNATKGSHTEIKTALWALSTLIFILVLVAVLIMNLRSSRDAESKR